MNLHMQRITSTFFALVVIAPAAMAQAPAGTPAPDTLNDPVRIMVSRLDLEKYKATIKGLTQFGDRRQGTDRNRRAVDWIEAQLKSYGCTNTERLTYTYQPRAVSTAVPTAVPTAPPTAVSTAVRRPPGGAV